MSWMLWKKFFWGMGSLKHSTYVYRIPFPQLLYLLNALGLFSGASPTGLFITSCVCSCSWLSASASSVEMERVLHRDERHVDFPRGLDPPWLFHSTNEPLLLPLSALFKAHSLFLTYGPVFSLFSLFGLECLCTVSASFEEVILQVWVLIIEEYHCPFPPHYLNWEATTSHQTLNGWIIMQGNLCLPLFLIISLPFLSNLQSCFS